MGVEQSLVSNTELKLAACNCRIVVIGPKSGDDCLVELSNLPLNARILAIGATLDDIKNDGTFYSEGNVILNINGNAKVLSEIINEMPFLVWIHSISAGVDSILCPEIVDNDDIVLTNAKGIFSSSLAEYALFACSYFAKNVTRLIEQQSNRLWEKFYMSELRGKTMAIIGYGDIGQKCAKLAKAYGMNVLALRRFPNLSNNDSLCDKTYGPGQLNELLALSDFTVVSLALTPGTYHFIKSENLLHAKKGMVLINIGRGALIDEDAMIAALEGGLIAGAALDVFTTEPLPADSKLWSLPNVLISPHNADLLIDSRQKSVRFFTENCVKFLAGEELDCIVNKKAGY